MAMPKIIFPFFFMLLVPTATLQAQWLPSNGPDAKSNYSNLFKDHNTFWAPCQGGLYFSTDEGEAWQRHPDIPTDENVMFVIRKDSSLFAMAENGTDVIFYKSNNNGINWVSTGSNLQNIWGIESQLLYSVGNSFILLPGDTYFYKSNDNGQHWEHLPLPDYINNQVSDGKRVAISTYPQGVFISADAGSNWTLLKDNDEVLSDINYIRDSTLIATRYINNEAVLLYSHDLGQSWHATDSLPTASSIIGFTEGYGNQIFAIGDQIYSSTDKGQSWQYYGKLDTFVFPVLRAGNGSGLRSQYEFIEKFEPTTGTWRKISTGFRNSTIQNISGNNQYVFALSIGSSIWRKPITGGLWQNIIPGSNYAYISKMTVSGDTVYYMGNKGIFQRTNHGTGPVDTLYQTTSWYFDDYFNIQGQYVVCYRDDTVRLIDRFTKVVNEVSLPGDSYNQFNIGFLVIGQRWIYTNDDGSIYTSDNQGATWIQKYAQNLPGNNIGNRLYFKNGRLFFCARNQILTSNDLGDNWITSTADFPTNEFGDLSTITKMVSSGNLLFASISKHGVYFSADQGSSWYPFNEGLNSSRQTDLYASNNTLYLGTYYTGIWERNIQFEAISGKVYSDQNNNGLRDNDEPSIPNVFIHAQPNGLFSQSDSTGAFTIFVDQSDSIRVIAPTPYAVVHPDYYIKGQAPTGSYDFGIYYTPNINDLRISATLSQPLVPGFSRTLFITCTNIGTTTITPRIVVHIPQPLLINTSAPPADLVSGDSLIWQLSDLETQQAVQLSVNLTVPATVNLAESFSFESIAYPIQGDQTPLDNHLTIRENIVASFDPNDKSVQPQDYFSPAQAANGERLYYTIRFQNTGNYQATFVRILDSLQENLDPATMRLETFSHPVKWFRHGKNVLEFLFENIHLPYATSDENASHGFVTFSIRPKPNLIIGTPISNRAFIYFDYNTPVETNTVVNKFDFLSAVSEAKMLTLQIYPNPTTGKFVVQNSDNQDIILLIYDTSGKPICTKDSNDARISVDISGIPTGSYWVFALDKNRRLIGKSVLVKIDK